MPVPTPFLGLPLGWFPGEVEGHTGNKSPRVAAWLEGELNKTWALGTTGNNLWGVSRFCVHVGVWGGEPSDFGVITVPRTSWFGVQSPQEAILGGSLSPPALPR